MHTPLGIAGIAVALIGYIGGLVIAPQSAPQQAVQELRFIHGALGVVIFGLAVCAYAISSAKASKDAEATGPRPTASNVPWPLDAPEAAADGARIGPITGRPVPGSRNEIS